MPFATLPPPMANAGRSGARDGSWPRFGRAMGLRGLSGRRAYSGPIERKHSFRISATKREACSSWLSVSSRPMATSVPARPMALRGEVLSFQIAGPTAAVGKAPRVIAAPPPGVGLSASPRGACQMPARRTPRCGD